MLYASIFVRFDIWRPRGTEDVQFFEQLDCAVHGLRRGMTAFRGAFFDATRFIGVVSRVVVIQFWDPSEFRQSHD